MTITENLPTKRHTKTNTRNYHIFHYQEILESSIISAKLEKQNYELPSLTKLKLNNVIEELHLPGIEIELS